jgi:hypothetical protein
MFPLKEFFATNMPLFCAPGDSFEPFSRRILLFLSKILTALWDDKTGWNGG